jgi:hypothetical protein
LKAKKRIRATKKASSSRKKATKKVRRTLKPGSKSRPRSLLSVPDTYEGWLAKQGKQRKVSEKTMKTPGVEKLPVSSREQWLRNQKVVEKEAKAEVKPAEDTYTEWLRRQISQKSIGSEAVPSVEGGKEEVSETTKQSSEPVELVA